MTGVVQGVGFRPFVFRLARSLDLRGHVGNDTEGVFVHVEGEAAALDDLERLLVTEAPPLARVDVVTSRQVTATCCTGFDIVASRDGPVGASLIPPDLGPCDACLAELDDPADRRHGYPLLNCTDCGPRFTITRSLPYDRPATTMADFPMCATCRAEYDDPTHRRFHAQPTACPACGPAVWLEQPVGARVSGGPDAVGRARAVIEAGGVVAVKGVGGYHLACRADADPLADRAVGLLRQRKDRPHKPFAVLVADVTSARRIAVVDAAEAALLRGPERPIVLLRAREGADLSPAVAPGTRLVGVMLPPSPLHHLLIPSGAVWVMTSGNRVGAPICIDDDHARAVLGPFVDAVLGHDRPILLPCDDSVVRVVDLAGPHPLPVRRSRGYAPCPIPLRTSGPPVLAVGGDLKATACLGRADMAVVSQHLGDLVDLETLAAMDRAVEHLERLLGCRAEVLACDAHPGYLSGRWARDHADGRPVVTVQHHHAHVAALLAEHGHPGPVIGFSFDGTGYGSDGTIWGGEVLLADLAGFERIGHLRSAPLPGGDAAVAHPARQALARLLQAGVPWTADLPPVAATSEQERSVLAVQVGRGLGTVATSSMGRLFDAVAALAGVRQVVSYEGQAAIELEALLETWPTSGERGYHLPVDEDGVWDPVPLLQAVVADVRARQPAAVVSHRFHEGVALAVVAAAERARHLHGLTTVGLTGGVFQNARLLQRAHRLLVERRFTTLVHRVVPPNDGGLALGQVAVARATT